MIKKNTLNANNSRRQFIKKAVYTTPSVLVLGKLLTPLDAVAGTSTIFGGTSGGNPAPSQSNARVKPSKL